MIYKNKKPSINKETLQNLSILRLIPNIATIAALCTGLSSIRFALLGQFEFALLAIIIAAILDGIDGRIARLLKATSDFGAELDSLSDFISFGVGPAIVIYILSLNKLEAFGWGVTIFFASCMGLRLARFNAMNIKQQIDQSKNQVNRSPVITAGNSKFFIGVPAPAGAMIVFLPFILHLAFGLDIFLNPYVYTIVMICTGLLLISKIPTYSLKSVTISRQKILLSMVIAAVVVTLLISTPWLMFSLIIISYLISILFSQYEYKKNTKQ